MKEKAESDRRPSADRGQQRDRQPTEDVPVAAVPEEVEASESESGETGEGV